MTGGTRVTGGAGGMPTHGSGWPMFNSAIGNATRDLNALGKSGKDAGKFVDVFHGPIIDRMRSLFSGTIGGAMAGYQWGGPGGAVALGGIGAVGDVVKMGGKANPQAGETFEQSWSLLETKIATKLGADYLSDFYSGRMQAMGKADDKGLVRDFMKNATGIADKTASKMPWWVPPGVSLGAGLTGALTGEKSEAPSPPSKALPIIPGVGAGMGSSMSYENFAMSLGMSTMNMSQLELEKVQTQLENLHETTKLKLNEIAEGIRNVGRIRPAFR